MFWRILPHATCCLASEKLFLLDLRQDRYFAVPPSLASATLAWLERDVRGSLPDDLAALLNRSRILRRGDPEPTNALNECIAIPAEIENPVAHDATPLPRTQQSAAIAATWIGLRSRSLLHILKARETRGRLRTSDRNAVSSLAAKYELGRSYTPITRNCLLDSLALDRLLARQGLSAKLVIGVCPTPFSAHCWLQTGDLILNDSFDHVSRFTPIYAA